MSLQAPPDEPVADFAGLLASLAALKESFPAETEVPLADDVAVLSYESALRAHRRAHPAMAAGVAPLSSPAAASSRSGRGAASAASENKPGQDRKCSSITVRMSPEECAQLRERAAEAGITVSAYLRSCAFEVESLRAQVKQTLAELRDPQRTEVPAAHPPLGRTRADSVPRPRLPWLKALWPVRRLAQSANEAPLSCLR